MSMQSRSSIIGLLNHSRRVAHTRHLSNQASNGRECSKQSVQPCPEQSRREGRSRCDARSVRFVRELERRWRLFQHSHNGSSSSVSIAADARQRRHKMPHDERNDFLCGMRRCVNHDLHKEAVNTFVTCLLPSGNIDVVRYSMTGEVEMREGLCGDHVFLFLK